MFQFPNIDPVAFSIGPLSVHWYGISYMLGFLIAYLIGLKLCQRPNALFQKKHLEDIIFYIAIGVIIGGRVGYVFFYNFEMFLHNPIWLFQVWKGGMSFHGGFLGVLFSLWIFCKKYKIDFIDFLDFTAPMYPLGLGFGRIANFIGQELWGRPTTAQWGIIFPNDPEGLYRHPSQLYESFFEGFVLFAIIYYLSLKVKLRGIMMCAFIFFYGFFRFCIEFLREPDQHIQFDLFGWMTRGQILCTFMMLFAIVAFYYFTDKGKKINKIF